jgi:hypothetical protein
MSLKLIKLGNNLDTDELVIKLSKSINRDISGTTFSMSHDFKKRKNIKNKLFKIKDDVFENDPIKLNFKEKR